MSLNKIVTYLLLVLNFGGCAYVHNVTLGEFDYRPNHIYSPFEIRVSETGFDIEEAAGWVDTLGGHGDNRYSQFADMISLFQMGPRTGKPIFNDKYTDLLWKSILKKCPSGKITGLLSIRETASYPVVSGEIIKVRGYCMEEVSYMKKNLKSKKIKGKKS